MNTNIRFISAWLLICLIFSATGYAQTPEPEKPQRHLDMNVVFDLTHETATVEIQVLYSCRISLSLQNDQNRTISRIVLNKSLKPGTHSFTISTKELKKGEYTVRAQEGSDVQTLAVTVR
jgi:hypothetical protein